MIKNKVLTLFLLLFLFGAITFTYAVNEAKAQTTYDIYLKSNGNGSIHYLNTSNGTQTGSTTSEVKVTVQSGQALQISNVPNTGFAFSSYTFNYAGGSGSLGTSTFTTTPIIEAFNITVNFSSISVFHVVTLFTGYGAEIEWSQGANSGSVGQARFADGSTVTFTGTAIEGYQWQRYEIDTENTPWSTNGGQHWVTAINPLTIEITSDFSIHSYASPLPTDNVTLTVSQGAYVGGHLEVYLGSDSTTHLDGVYTVATGTNIEVRAIPDANYAFINVQSLGTEYGVGSQILGTTNPVRFSITMNQTIFGYFETDRFVLTPEAVNGEYTLRQNTTNHFYVNVFTNRTTLASGNYLIFLSDPASTLAGANSDSIFMNLVTESTRFQNGQFSFDIASPPYSESNRYYSLRIVVLFDGVTYNNTVWSNDASISDIGYTWFDGILQLFGAPMNALEHLAYDSVTLSQGYNLHFLSYSESVATPTPAPLSPTDVLSWLWNGTTRLIFGCIALIGLTALFVWLFRKQAPLEGALLGLTSSLIINMLVFSWSPWALFVVVCLIVYLIFSEVRNRGKG